MSARVIAAYALAVLLGGLLAIPALAGATTVGSPGGSSLTPGTDATSPPGAGVGIGSQPGNGTGQSGEAVVQPGNVTVTATSGQMTLSVNASTMLRSAMSFYGTLPSSAAGQTVEIERLGHETNWQWAPTTAATVSPDGAFSAVWSTNHIGRFLFRALISQPGSGAGASVPPTLTATVYRPSIATEYGPGFYGRRTACGKRLRRNTIGVANRTLRCGTKVAIYYRGRTMVVPVIDRGPYANHADWDLTEATGRAIGLPGKAKIGAVSLPQQPAAP